MMIISVKCTSLVKWYGNLTVVFSVVLRYLRKLAKLYSHTSNNEAIKPTNPRR